MNPGSHDWDEQIKQYQKENKFRIEFSDFAGIYEQETKKKKATALEMTEGLKAVDPNSKDAGNDFTCLFGTSIPYARNVVLTFKRRRLNVMDVV